MGYRDLAYRFYWKLEKAIVPELADSQYRYKEVLKSVVTPGLEWLDLGCGHQIFPAFMSSSEKEEKELVGACRLAVGLDYTENSLRQHRSLSNLAVGDIQKLPFGNRTFDVVSANMVMEHIEHPTKALTAIRQILKPGGVFIFHTVNVLNYSFLAASLVPQTVKNKLIWLLEGRAEHDVFPTFYHFNTKTRVEALATRSGFNVVRLELLNSTATTVQLGPVVIPELAFIRVLQAEFASKYRSNIIGMLQKCD